MALGKTLGSVMTYGGHLHSEKVIFGRGSPLGFYRFKFRVCLRRNDQLHPVASSTNDNLPAALHALPPKLKSQLRLSSLFRNPVFCKFGFRIAVDWFLIVYTHGPAVLQLRPCKSQWNGCATVLMEQLGECLWFLICARGSSAFGACSSGVCNCGVHVGSL